jgi:hypothetical protein
MFVKMELSLLIGFKPVKGSGCVSPTSTRGGRGGVFAFEFCGNVVVFKSIKHG